MASLPSSPNSSDSPQANLAAGLSPEKRMFALSMVTALFFMWGFITCLNDIILPHLKSVFELNYFQASMVQFVFFGAYFLTSIPAGRVIGAMGYQKGMVVGLLTAAAGTLLFYPAASYLSYNLFLAALFVLATGITILQVAANPYISVLGNSETASSRLNLAQAFNSFGTTLAPWVGGVLILAQVAHGAGTTKLEQAASVKIPYLELTGILVVLAVIFASIKLPAISAAEEGNAHHGTFSDALKHPHLIMAIIGIFLYVGAEVAIGSYLVNFMMEPDVTGFTKEKAASFLSYYWGGAMIGRFIGSALLQKIHAGSLLAINAACATVLLIIGLCSGGYLAMVAVLAVGFFNSIMFPNIFTLGINGLGHLTSRGSSLLVMAIVGGAIVPAIMGKAADMFGVHLAFIIPAICYLYIIYFGWKGCRLVRS